MASFDSLNDGQRAVLQLLLKQGKSYDELAGLLKTDAAGVRERARGAVDALGGKSLDVGSDRRNEIADYLLGQQTASQRAAAREYLEDSSAGRGWARTVAGALAPVAGDALPDIPAEREEVAQAFDALDRRTARQQEVQRSSKMGSWILVGAVGLALAIAVILVLSLGGGDDDTPVATKTATTPVPATPTDLQVLAQGTLAPPAGGVSKAKGQVAIVRIPSTNRFRFALQAEGLPPSSTRGSAYGVWLYNSPKENQFLGFPDTIVGKEGTLEAVADLSPNTPNYKQILLTRETGEAPKKPGTVVLRARMVTASQTGGGTATTPPTTTTP